MEKKIRRLAPEVEYLNKKRSKNENKEKLRGRNKIYQEKFLELQCRSFKMERGHQMHRMWLKRFIPNQDPEFHHTGDRKDPKKASERRTGFHSKYQELKQDQTSQQHTRSQKTIKQRLQNAGRQFPDYNPIPSQATLKFKGQRNTCRHPRFQNLPFMDTVCGNQWRISPLN